ncbi:calcium-binding protein [Marinivivus vitaminiproducens]|uniref:calcium-binding protein n=1 Tax=Marinivivus vitaminiproducens TaxID=3035935 RepID=UPI0027996CAC|nr:calcium-binding protein [Geminicoccaceae bacterium SCSIO 64248]
MILTGKAGSSLSFAATATDARLDGDYNPANVNDAIIYDLIVNGVRDYRLDGITAFSLGSGADVLNLTVRDADPAFAYDLDVSASGRSGSDVIWTGTGDDRVRGGFGDDLLHGYDGNDRMYGDEESDIGVAGQAGDDIVRGGRGNDVLYGDGPAYEGGDDRVYGEEGDDEIYGSLGADTLYGGSGEDTVYGDSEGSGGSSSDILYGGSGDDILIADSTFGTANGGHDTLYGGDGDDELEGGAPRSSYVGTDDRLYGGNGRDEIVGDRQSEPGGEDRLYGGGSDDRMYGDAFSVSTNSRLQFGDDRLDGGDGDDVLYGDAASASVYGGGSLVFGDDVFVLAPGGSDDRIRDFGNGGDKLDVTAWEFTALSDMTITGNGSTRVRVDFDSDNSVTLERSGSSLTISADDFIFA